MEAADSTVDAYLAAWQRGTGTMAETRLVKPRRYEATK